MNQQNKNSFRGKSIRPPPSTSLGGATPKAPAKKGGAPPFQLPPVKKTRVATETGLPHSFRGNSRRPPPSTSLGGATPKTAAKKGGAPPSQRPPKMRTRLLTVTGLPQNQEKRQEPKQRNNELKEELKTSHKQVQQLEQRNKRLEGQMKKKEGKVITLENINKKLREQMKENQDEKKQLEQANNDLQGQINKNQVRMKELRKRIKGLQSKNGASQKKVEELEQTNKKLQDEIEKSQTNVQELEQTNQRLQEEMKGLQLTHCIISPDHPRGICLLINNLKFTPEAEKKLCDLFRNLSFDVKVKCNLQRTEMIRVVEEFAEKDHSTFDSFVLIIMAWCQGNGICGVDGNTTSLEQLMSVYKPAKCKSLQGKPKLFFVQLFTFLERPNSGDGSTLWQCSTDSDPVMQPSSPLFIGRNNCPGQADFLLTCVTTAVDKATPEPEVVFPQVFIEVIEENHDGLHVLDILTLVNGRMANSKRPNGVTATQAPFQNHTLRVKVQLGLTNQGAGSTIPDVVRRNCYELHNNPRGYCVIINNVDFDNPRNKRLGADKDEDCLTNLFNYLHFKVIVERNLKSDDMEKLAASYGDEDHTHFNAFVMIVMSHGKENDYILGIDESSTKVKDLMMKFQETRCPSLKNKPKVFIIQTCRGNLRRSAADDVSSRPVPSASTQVGNDSTLPRSVVPIEADFLLAFATAPGYVAFRSEVNGTYYIQSLVKTIERHRHDHHFLEILMLVTELVVKKEEEKKERRPTVQVPACVNTLTKFLYL